MRKLTCRPRPLFTICSLLLAALLLFSGCRNSSDDLRLADLTPGELLYFQRLLDLERAKTITWADRERGNALLDSISLAWGDSAEVETTAGLSTDPAHSAAVGRLLLRVLEAEHDSLTLAPETSRLGQPLPDPDRQVPLPVWTPADAPPDST